MSYVVVFGSFNVDCAGRMPHMPGPGETLMGSTFQMGPGGKGANQAVAAAKAGAPVRMIAKLGQDAFARIALDSFAQAGVQTDSLLTGDCATGTAMILVEESTGQNRIVVLPGANHDISQADIQRVAPVLEGSSFVLVQLENNIDATLSVIDLCKRAGVPVLLNPAPAATLPREVYQGLYAITPNEIEAQQLTGIDCTTQAGVRDAAQWFVDAGVRHVVLTLGQAGAYVQTPDTAQLVDSYAVQAVDTTGAGDAFSGALLAALYEGKPFLQAVTFASATAALSVTRSGAAVAMPTRAEIDAFIQSH